MEINTLLSCLGPIVVALITAVIGPLVVAAVKRRDEVTTAPNPSNTGANTPNTTGTSNISSLAIASLALGVFNLCSWYLPICGLPMSLLGIIFGFSSMNSSRRGFAIAGIALSIFGLIASAINSAYGAYLGYTGQLF